MVVSPCTTFTLPENVASFFLSRISSVAASIWIGWSRFCENPCMALGTPCTALCAPASLAAISASANAAVQARCAIRRPKVLRGENFIIRSFRIGGFAGRPRLGWRGRVCGCQCIGVGVGRLAGGRRTVHDQIHHDIAFEPDYLAAAGYPELVRGQISVQ